MGGTHRGVAVDQVLFEQLMVETVESQLETVGDAELVVDLAQVVLDNLFGGADLVGDLFVAHAAGDAADDGQLFFGELGLDLGVGEAGGLGAVGFDDPADGLVVDPGLTLGDLADAFDEQVGGDGAGHDSANAAAVELDGIGFVGLGDLDDELGFGGLTDEFGDGIDGAGDELAFEQDDIGGVALQGGVEILERLHLSNDPDVIFEGKDFLHADAVDRLRIREDYTNAGGMSGVLFRHFIVATDWVKIDYGHRSSL